jgi:hypothetical protein
MHPLGGLASADAPHRPWANFVTVLFGPLVNVVICLLAVLAMMIITGTWRIPPWNPLSIDMQAFVNLSHSSTRAFFFCFWVYAVSYAILVFNLLPIFPLDGGQMLQSLLWAKIGYYRATMFASITGMIGAGVFAMYGLATRSLFVIFLAIWGFQFCLYKYRELKANGPWGYQDDVDYGLGGGTATARKLSARKIRRAQKLEREAEAEQDQIDAILAKVSAHGMQSLTWWEKRALKAATKHQRERDMEIARSRRS